MYLAHYDFEETTNDDEIIVTCFMCGIDCPLSELTSGRCPECASLCASVPPARVPDCELRRRARLICLCRRALLRHDAACNLLSERKTALRPSRACIEEAAEFADHFGRRANILQSLLADESGLAKWQVFNDLKNQYPLCSRLLTAGL